MRLSPCMSSHSSYLDLMTVTNPLLFVVWVPWLKSAHQTCPMIDILSYLSHEYINIIPSPLPSSRLLASAWSISAVFQHDVTIMTSGEPISGETYNLTCTVEANVQPTVQWLYSSNGDEVTNDSNITVGTPRTTGSTTTLTLSFNPLHTSHGGQYTCQSMIGAPASTVNATRNVTVHGECIDRHM